MKYLHKYRVDVSTLFLFFLLLWSTVAIAQDLPPAPENWVSDYADLLSEGEENRLNAILQSYSDTTSNEVVVAIFQDAQGYPVEDFSIRLAETWKIGKENRDNGIILAIFMEERKIRVEVGYGLEDKVTDAVAIQIAQNIISPLFKSGNYQKGIQEGLNALMQAASGKYRALEQKGSGQDKRIRLPYVFLVFLFIFILSLLRRRRFSSVSSRGYRNSGPFWWGGFGGGRGGGFGGGGFSGGGGGSFGGGGATGSW